MDRAPSRRSKRAAAALAAVLSLGTLGVPASSSSAPPSPEQGAAVGRSTPELIEAATARGDIGRVRADLYMAWALGSEWRRVPARFRSDVPWDGTLPLLRLSERVVRMSPGPARAEIEDALTAERVWGAGSCGGGTGGAA